MSNVHFLLRYSDKITKVDTILEHEKILNSNDRVWMGKFGVGMSESFYNKATEQISNNSTTFLYLMSGAKYTHKALISGLAKGKTAKSEIESIDKSKTPAYYRNRRCSIWFKLSKIEEFDSCELEKLWLYKSPNLHPSGFGMRGLIYLTYRDGPLEVNKQETKLSKLYTGGLFD